MAWLNTLWGGGEGGASLPPSPLDELSKVLNKDHRHYKCILRSWVNYIYMYMYSVAQVSIQIILARNGPSFVLIL